MTGKSPMEIVDQILVHEKRTRGCLHTEMDKAQIKRTPESDDLLIAEFEKETNLRRKWFIACLIQNIHESANRFFEHHKGFDEYDNHIFIESPE